MRQLANWIARSTRIINYRPVSLTVILCKVFESLVRDKMIEHLERFSLIKDMQHGFVKNKSCLTNLLVFLEEVTNYIDSGYLVDVIIWIFKRLLTRFHIEDY